MSDEKTQIMIVLAILLVFALMSKRQTPVERRLKFIEGRLRTLEEIDDE